MTSDELNAVPRHACGKFAGGFPCHCTECADVAGGMSRADARRKRLDWEAECLARHGWYAVHVVCGPPDRDTPTGTNSFTVGLADNFGHPDFQIVMPLNGNVAHDVFWILTDRVKAGETFRAGQEVAGVAMNYRVRFAAATLNGRDYLRVIVPDRAGRLTPDVLEGTFLLQYVGTPEAPEPADVTAEPEPGESP